MPPMSMSWWAAGAIGAARKRHDGGGGEQQPPFRSVALVVGSTGIVGTSLVDILPLPDTPGGPWKVYALSRRPPPPWSPPPPAAVTHLCVDLADAAAVAEALAPLTDITHVFYVALAAPHLAEARSREANAGMLRNVLAAVVPTCPALAHVALQTGSKHYIGPPESVGKLAVETPFSEDMPRHDYRNFYYDQEDVLFDAVVSSSSSRRAGAAAVTWSVHRPSLIFGFSPRSAMNAVCSLCVYAAICRKERRKLRWPGSLGAWEGFSNASDADLVAEQQIWAAIAGAAAKNEAFNCSNGNIYKWKQLWPVLAGKFGVEWAGYEGEERRVGLTAAMAGKEAVWAEIVAEEKLVATELGEVANWWFVDALFMDKWEFIDTMNKSKEHGFLGFRNTVRSFEAWIDKMKLYRIVP
ncbi:3-oxo-Delta(4,5)-steroid 5-beta-reductase-like [Oryza glaberrima]|uniref:3-oxo-Delta(4,5)-steroid 5-beta-reductase-like n=1 Tax=Oryza glaberrima TaxID=4538 RepID=UPI00224C2AD8|nr:3-oxo-Delta(4,5)-steroid 5-beta-reductase-like [Oryza glaberrima]